MKKLNLKITKIVSGIKIPPIYNSGERRSSYGKSIYPINTLKVNESFGVEFGNQKPQKVSSYMSSIINTMRRKGLTLKTKKFVVRRLEKEVRVFRVK